MVKNVGVLARSRRVGEIVTRLAKDSPIKEAIEQFERAVRHHQAGEVEDAERLYRALIAAAPDSAAAHCNLGSLLRTSGRMAEAAAALDRAIALEPTLAVAHCELASCQHARGEGAEAIASAEEAIRLNPDYAEAHANRGLFLHDAGRREAALESLGRAVELRPAWPQALGLRGVALRELDRPEEALTDFDTALRHAPEAPGTHSNRAAALHDMGRYDDALVAHARAVSLAPEWPELGWNQAQTLLLTGRFEEGFAAFERRLECRAAIRSRHPQPRWDGEPLEGRTILLTLERGFGDAIQFCRYAPMIEERGGRVALECPRPLWRLLESGRGIDTLVRPGEAPPECEIQAPLISLPAILGTRLESIPAEVLYLSPPAEAPSALAHALEATGTLTKVGIAWAGSTDHPRDRRRSCPLDHFLSLTAVPGVALLSLQKERTDDEVTLLRRHPEIIDLSSWLDDFAATAAVVARLDLVIAVDTALAHLAGALARPVWTCLAFTPDWRWLVGREDTPWYPTMRLFRQPTPGDWGAVIERVADALETDYGAKSSRV